MCNSSLRALQNFNQPPGKAACTARVLVCEYMYFFAGKVVLFQCLSIIRNKHFYPAVQRAVWIFNNIPVDQPDIVTHILLPPVSADHNTDFHRPAVFLYSGVIRAAEKLRPFLQRLQPEKEHPLRLFRELQRDLCLPVHIDGFIFQFPLDVHFIYFLFPAQAYIKFSLQGQCEQHLTYLCVLSPLFDCQTVKIGIRRHDPALLKQYVNALFLDETSLIIGMEIHFHIRTYTVLRP